MTRKTTKQKLVEKLYKEHGIIISPETLYSFRRNGYGSRMISWSTIGNNRGEYESFYRMSDCVKYPTKPIAGIGCATVIDIDWDKIEGFENERQ